MTPADEPSGTVSNSDIDDKATEEKRDTRYKSGVAIALATLAILGAWIAILLTNASTNESNTARDNTRLAAQAQSARVIELGALSAISAATAEIETLDQRAAFVDRSVAGIELGIAPDQGTTKDVVDKARDAILAVVASDDGELFALQTEARRLALEQAAMTDARVTWNARASQYETVITVLGVALFLIGFAAVVARKLRPPLTVPGLILAVYCFGWAIFIYAKPIPNVAPVAIDNTATGEALLQNGRLDEAIAAFDTAISADPRYRPPYEGRALAALTIANPDIGTTGAFTNSDQDAFESAIADLERARELGGTEDVVGLTLSGMAALSVGDYDLADRLLRSAVDKNGLTPGLQFSLSAVAVARGDDVAALSWRDRAIVLLGEGETDANRSLFALYYTLLELVAHNAPEQAQSALDIERATMRLETERSVGHELAVVDNTSASIRIERASYSDGALSVDLSVTDVEPNATITVVGFEKPAIDASWVQPAETFYVGPPGDSGDISVPAVRACNPTEFRFDLYVNGTFASSAEAAGGDPTC